MNCNKKLYKVNCLGKRYVVHQGGTGSGKTFSVLQYLSHYAALHQGKIISVVAETLPHLKRGAMRDFKRILQMSGWSTWVQENKTDHRFHVGSSVVEFFPADSEAKLRGARRDILFINECNNIDYESFQQLDVRTRCRTILDFNPVCRFWVHDKLLPELHEADHLFIKSTYADNVYLTPEEKQNIERRRNNTNWWKVYGEGEIGMQEGLIFQNWCITSLRGASDEAISVLKLGLPRPTEAGLAVTGVMNEDSPETNHSSLITYHSQQMPGHLLGYGIDFGFTHSPTAIVQVNEYNGELYVHELFYRSGAQNEELFAFAQKYIKLNALAIADSAEPKTVDYLYRKGWTGLKAALKGEDSVEFGINLLLERKINVTPESVNLIKELRQYMWDTNKDGAIIRRPIKDFDHAIDALRYIYSYPRKKQMLFS
ncbi:MAG TPA: terminase large subunit [Bacteroidia bacterium]|nr:terminase large subunit [Bacteroidia bacterium]